MVEWKHKKYSIMFRTYYYRKLTRKKRSGNMEEDFLVVIPEHVSRLLRIDFFNWLKETYSEEFIPHIGQEVEYSIELPEKVKDKVVYTVADVGIIFDCGKEKALKIIHLMERYECSTKIGKDYYTTKEKIMEFMNANMGLRIAI